MSEDNTNYLMSIGLYVKIERMKTIAERLDILGYGVSDLGIVDLITGNFEVNSVRYNYWGLEEVPIKKNGLEKGILKNE